MTKNQQQGKHLKEASRSREDDCTVLSWVRGAWETVGKCIILCSINYHLDSGEIMYNMV